MTEEEWDKVMAVNTKGVFLCCQAAAKIMLRQGSGRLINTGSGQSRDGFIYTPHYAASKMGVDGNHPESGERTRESMELRSMPSALELSRRICGRITISCGENCLGDYKEGELVREWIETKIPMKRGGTPEDMAGLVTFLASEDAAYITGQTINVDGGLIMS